MGAIIHTPMHVQVLNSFASVSSVSLPSLSLCAQLLVLRLMGLSLAV